MPSKPSGDAKTRTQPKRAAPKPAAPAAPAAAPKKKAAAPKKKAAAAPKKKAAAAPKKAAAAPKKAAAAAPKKAGDVHSHPTYAAMVKHVILRDTLHFISAPVIASRIQSHYPGSPRDTAVLRRHLRVALQSMVSKGLLSKHKQSYKLTSKGREKKKAPRKAVPAKPAAAAAKPKKKASPKVAGGVKKAKAAPKKKAAAAAKPKAQGGKVALARSRSKGASEDAPAGMGKGDVIWQYMANDKKWANYEPDASATVEKVYQDYLTNRGTSDIRAIKSGDWDYQIDFLAMTQKNVRHEAHTVRNIRRSVL